MTTPRTDSCEARIDDYMADRLGRLAQDFKWLDAWSQTRHGDDRADQARTRIDESFLSVDIHRTLRITFGTGGPEDFLEVEIDEDGVPCSNPVYVFRDWFDRAERQPTAELREAATRLLSETGELVASHDC